jgi:hypothetical protein
MSSCLRFLLFFASRTNTGPTYTIGIHLRQQQNRENYNIVQSYRMNFIYSATNIVFKQISHFVISVVLVRLFMDHFIPEREKMLQYEICATEKIIFQGSILTKILVLCIRPKTGAGILCRMQLPWKPNGPKTEASIFWGLASENWKSRSPTGCWIFQTAHLWLMFRC